MKITTNHHWREFICGWELTETQLKDFDWMIEPENSCNFIKYNNNILALEEFMAMNRGSKNTPSEFKAWHGYTPLGYGHGYLIRVSECGECYQIAHYC